MIFPNFDDINTWLIDNRFGVDVFTLIAILLVLTSISLHEVGHAVAMNHYGIKINRAGLGLSVGPHLTLKLRRFDFPITFSPLLIGAYVQPDEISLARLKQMPYNVQAICFGAGVLVNLLFGGITLSAFEFMRAINPSNDHAARSLKVGLIMATLTGLIWLGRRIFCMYLIPLLGTLLAIQTVASMFSSPSAVTGPIGIARMLVSPTLADAVIIGAVVSIGIGMFNMFPLMPLDCGRTMDAALRKWNHKVAQTWSAISTWVFLALFSFIFFNDIFG